jgi:hypothetical protein
MAGLVPAFHVFPHPTLPRMRRRVGWGKTWMPAKTRSPPRNAMGCHYTGMTSWR